MRFFFYLCLAAFLTSSCDDGDIVVTSFNFDEETVQLCTTSQGNAANSSTNYTFFKINDDTQETLAFTITTQDPILTEPSASG